MKPSTFQWRNSDAIDLDEAITAIAPFYNLDFGFLNSDISMYKNLAERSGGRILELGSGTGRLAIPLALAGYTVTALESNSAMIRLGEKAMHEAGISICASDMRGFSADEPFDLIICALSTFCHLLSASDQRSALATVTRNLSPGGFAVFDLPALSSADWDTEPQPLQLEWVRTDPLSGRVITKLSTFEAYPADQIQLVTYIYDEQIEPSPITEQDFNARPGHGIRRTLAQFLIRHVFRFEMEKLLMGAGLSPVGWYGTYEMDSPPDGDRLIVIARHMEEVIASE